MELRSAIEAVDYWAGPAPQIRRSDMAGRETILVADDDAAILQMLEFILVDAGYNVVKASDGEEALDLIKVHRPDLVLLDFMMPNVDGCTVCRRLKSDDDTRCLPVVIMSADRQVALRALEANADAYLIKPFNLDDMIGCVQGWLEHSRQQECAD